LKLAGAFLRFFHVPVVKFGVKREKLLWLPPMIE
jgi:hypothetical protein